MQMEVFLAVGQNIGAYFLSLNFVLGKFYCIITITITIAIQC